MYIKEGSGGTFFFVSHEKLFALVSSKTAANFHMIATSCFSMLGSRQFALQTKLQVVLYLTILAQQQQPCAIS